MTQAQILTLADQHRTAHSTNGTGSPSQTDSGPGLMAMAAWQ
jgi:hypothetical protein